MKKENRDSTILLFACCIFAFTRVSCHLQVHQRFSKSRRFERDAYNPNRQSLFLDRSIGGQEDRSRAARLPDLLNNCDGGTKVTTFALNPNGASGGFGDRLRGMVTTYYLAIMTNSSFEIDWTRPYNLTDYFAVPSCDGHERAKHQKQSAAGSGDVVAMSFELPGDGKIIRTAHDDWKYFTDSLFIDDTGKNVEIHTNSFHWKEVVRHEEFRERAASLNLSNLSQAELFKLAIDELLRNPTSVVIESFESVMRRLSAGSHDEESSVSVPYVGVQVRLGGRNNGDVSGWDDPSRHSLEEVDCFAAEAMRLCRLMHIKSIFVTADSEEAARKFEDAVAQQAAAARSSSSNPPPPPIVVQVPGNIGHTDRSIVASEHARDVWLKSIMDWWVLKHASALVISRSAFGETAAAASDVKVAQRLKISPTAVPQKAGKRRNGCEFQNILLREEDIFK